MKKVLVLGATGAMGLPLVKILLEMGGIEVYATSRKKHESVGVKWIVGNGHELDFLDELLSATSFDAVVDFLNYSTESFRQRYERILDKTSQYIFLSSARVYAPIDNVIDEKSPRILDVCCNEEYLKGDSYDLAKARQEDILINSKYNNYTILRPSLTYNDRRLQLALYEMEEWLSRVMDGNSIVFPKEMCNITTTMTHGGDVALLISRLLFNEKAKGETFNINGGGHETWGRILEIYANALKKTAGIDVKVFNDCDAGEIARKLYRYYQYIYARGINRIFCNKKIESVTGKIDYTSIEDGLTHSIENLLKNKFHVQHPYVRTVAYLDRISNEWTHMRHFSGFRSKIYYFLYRTGMKKI